MDREKQPTLTMRVRAKEKTASVVRGTDNSSSVNVTVTLLDANDNNPSFVPSNLYEFTAYSDAAIGDVVGQVSRHTKDLQQMEQAERQAHLLRGPGLRRRLRNAA